MICDLEKIENILTTKSDLEIKAVNDRATLNDFISVLEPYDSNVSEFYQKMNEELFSSNERLIVGYANGIPATMGILYIKENSAGIFSLITNENMRGKGYGTDMMVFLMNLAKENECQFVTLSASSDSGFRIYENLGFRKTGEFECFEYVVND